MSSYDFTPATGLSALSENAPKPPPATRTVKVRAHTRTIKQKQPAPPAVVNTQTIRPVQQPSTAKRFKPHYPGEPAAGYVPVSQPSATAGTAPPLLTKRPYYTDAYTRLHHHGPAGQESTQWNAAQVAQAHQIQRQNLGTPGYILRSLLPGGLDEGGVQGPGKALTRGLGVASMLPGGGVGEAAGILGFGLKGLRVVRTGKDVVEAAPVVKAAAEVAPRTPTEIVRGAMPGAKIVRGKQEAGYSVERGKRAAAAAKAMEAGGLEGHIAAKTALRGELPKVHFSGFGELTPQNLEDAFRTVQTHPHLTTFQKIRVNDALQAATEGKVPTRSDLTLIEHVFGKDVSGTLNDSQELGLWAKTMEAINVPRSLMASFDLSAPFRQGLVAIGRHPVLSARNFAPMIKSFGSEGVYRGVMQDIVSRPSFPLMQEAKLALTDFEHGYTGAEEQFIGHNMAEKIPVVGRGVRGSGRAYTGYLNKTRADVFDHLIRVAQNQGVNVQDEKFLRSLGSYINSSTGRGTYGAKALEESLPVLNAAFFSPRLLASRINFLNPVWYAKQDPFVRKQALRAAFQTLGAGMTVLGLAAAAGAKVGRDPRNADFGKIRLGNTRIDLWGGFQQPMRLVAQLASGKIISSTTGKTLTLGASGPGKLSRGDIAERFFVSKLAPTPSFLWDVSHQRGAVGTKFDLKSEVASRLTPLLMQDARSLYQDRHGGMDGIAAALAGYGLGMWGIGTQTYGPKAPKTRPGAPAGGSSYDFTPSGGGGSSYDFTPSGAG